MESPEIKLFSCIPKNRARKNNKPTVISENRRFILNPLFSKYLSFKMIFKIRLKVNYGVFRLPDRFPFIHNRFSEKKDAESIHKPEKTDPDVAVFPKPTGGFKYRQRPYEFYFADFINAKKEIIIFAGRHRFVITAD